MAELTDIEYESVLRIIKDSIHDEQLQLELIDHCCCCIEERMENGQQFEDALTSALNAISDDGMQEIEAELNRLLKTQIPTQMKITLYFSGFLATFFILLGLLFRTLHWPFANMFLFIGNMSLIVTTITLLSALMRFPSDFPATSRMRSISGAAGGLIIGAGSVFKIMHWPGANILTLLGMLLIIFVFVPLFFWQLYKREIQTSQSE
jgi:hypothetical protein